MSFQIIIIVIMILLLIVCLTIIGMTLKKGGTANERIIPQCPDYWLMDPSGNSCRNVKQLGTCQQETMDFSISPFVGTDGTCAKYNWATKCGLAWENITYGVSKSPCDTSTTTTT